MSICTFSSYDFCSCSCCICLNFSILRCLAARCITVAVQSVTTRIMLMNHHDRYHGRGILRFSKCTGSVHVPSLFVQDTMIGCFPTDGLGSVRDGVDVSNVLPRSGKLKRYLFSRKMSFSLTFILMKISSPFLGIRKSPFLSGIIFFSSTSTS